MPMPPIRIAVVDDETLFRKGIRMIFDRVNEIDVVLEAGNGQELLDKLDQTSSVPDVLLIDLNMPVLDGIETTKILQKTHPDLKIIILSSYFRKAFVVNMIELGAASYLPKNASPEEVIKTIREVTNKGFSYNDQVMSFIRDNMIRKTREKASFGAELSSRELEILTLICHQYTAAEIAEKLFLSPRTVEGHRNNLLQKLNCRNTAGLVVYALQHELVPFSPQFER